MIISEAYDVEILPNFFSVGIISITDYLKIFADCVKVDKKGKKTNIPLVQVLSVEEIVARLATVKKKKFYITDTDDSQLFPLLGALNNMSPYQTDKGDVVRTDMFGYNSGKYDRLMISALMMFAGQVSNTKELITKLYNSSRKIIDTQNDPDLARSDFFLNNLKKYNLPYNDIDVMTIFALNKAGSGFDKDTGKKVYYGKSLKQTSINLQWYQLLEHDLPPIGDNDYKLYWSDTRYKGLDAEHLNKVIDKWDRYILPEHIADTMHYMENDIFIVCEMVRLYIDEIRLRYSISNSYKVNVLSSSRSNIADVLFTKFYSEFSGLNPKQWQGQKTERTAMAFKRVILPDIKFKTPELQALLADMMKVIVYSVSKDSFIREVKLGNLIYTIATGGIHTQDDPRELKSKCIPLDSSTGEKIGPSDKDWSNLTDDSYILVHFDISSFYPRLIVTRKIAPAHLDEATFVKLVGWVMNTRIAAKHSTEEFIDGIPKGLLAEALKIVINSIYGKLGYEFGDLMDKMAVLKVTINGQLMIMMVCEDLELNNIEVMSANTDGIVVKLYKRDKEKFEKIVDDWKKATNLEADSEEYEMYINRDINNYFIREYNGKMMYKGALHPTMYANDLTKGYDMPVVAQACVNYFVDNKPVLESLYECTNILDFCKTQNVGRQFHVQFTKDGESKEMQRHVRFYVSNTGGAIHKVANVGKSRSNLAAGMKVTPLNTLDDKSIARRNINYPYYYDQCMKIINPIKLGISPNRKGDRSKGVKSGKALIKQFGGQFNTLFDDLEED